MKGRNIARLQGKMELQIFKTHKIWQVCHEKILQNDKNLKFDWNNLFLSCAHCNNTKGNKYAPILDCTHIDVDRRISFHFLNPLTNEREIFLEALDESPETQNTLELLTDVYYGRTPQKKALY